jgi:hypothetical protein
MIVFLVACGLALGQDRKPLDDVPNPKKSEVFEEQEWYVAKASGGVSERPIELYAGPSKAEAEEACRKWEAANKATKPTWITTVSDPIKVKVPVLRPATTRDKPKIEFQDPKFVDPGSTKKVAKFAPELKGKKAQGQIGDLKVTFEFADRDKLEITGDATGSGKWTVEGSSLYMETRVATYRAIVTEAGGAGLRFWKDGSQPLTQWSFRFEKEPAKEAKPAKETNLTTDKAKIKETLTNNTWWYLSSGPKSKTDSTLVYTVSVYKFNTDQTLEWYYSGPEFENNSDRLYAQAIKRGPRFRGTWSVRDDGRINETLRFTDSSRKSTIQLTDDGMIRTFDDGSKITYKRKAKQ